MGVFWAGLPPRCPFGRGEMKTGLKEIGSIAQYFMP
jgi:hypothetical protein